jgi:hypothetical protein
MAFFDKFPIFKYDVNKDGKSTLAVNILRRVAFREAIKNQSNYFQEYTVEDGETPEMVSHKFYGTPNLHWTILLLNETLNPFFDWPMSQHSLENFVEKKYTGQAFYLGHEKDFVTVPGTEHSYIDKDTEVHVSDRNSTQERSIRGLTKEWDPTLRKLVLYNIPHFKEFAVDDVLTATTNTGSSVSATITRIVKIHGQAAHHFEDTNGNKINPVGTPPDATGLQISVGSTGASPYGITAPNFTDTISYSYSNSNDASATTWKTITNHAYEDTLNESKRSVKLLRPDMVRIVVDNFEEVIKS